VLYRKIGKSGPEASSIGLGSWLTLAQTVEKRESARCVAAALECGVTFFDTADVYGFGEAERVLGENLMGFPREKIVIGTKCFFPMSPTRKGLSRKHILESVENSLRNLRVEYLDLMQCHRFDPETPLPETIAAMSDLVQQGKIRHWGVSRWTATQVDEAVLIAASTGGQAPISNQCPYNAINNSIERELFPACVRTGMGILAYSPLAQGILSGKYSLPEPPQGSRAANPELKKGMWDYKPENLAKAAALGTIAHELGATMAQLALAWCLRNPVVASVIIGASHPEQIYENVKATELNLSDSQIERIEAVMGRGLNR
jgi:aryl-alcohol dehydrogenase-like predicted oxidoreductase